MFTVRDPTNPNLLLHVEPIQGVTNVHDTPAKGAHPARQQPANEDNTVGGTTPAAKVPRVLFPAPQAPVAPAPAAVPSAQLVDYCQQRLLAIARPLVLFAAEMRTKLGLDDDRRLLNYTNPVFFTTAPSEAIFITLHGAKIGPLVMQALMQEYQTVHLPLIEGSSRAPDAFYYAFLQACTEVEQWPNLSESHVYPAILNASFYGALSAACNRINALTQARPPIALHQLITNATPKVHSMFQGMVATHMLEGPGFNVYAMGGKSGKGINRYALSAGIKTREQRARMIDAYDLWFKTVYRMSGTVHPRYAELRAMYDMCNLLQPDEETSSLARLTAMQKTSSLLDRK
jgi:hypothetical protein